MVTRRSAFQPLREAAVVVVLGVVVVRVVCWWWRWWTTLVVVAAALIVVSQMTQAKHHDFFLDRVFLGRVFWMSGLRLFGQFLMDVSTSAK